MKTKTTHQCEICGNEFDKAERAIECEARGVPTNFPPVGLITMGEPGDFYDHRLAFGVSKTEVRGHEVSVYSWACRDNGYGDNLGDSWCSHPDCNEFREEWRERPPFQRLVKYMQQIGVTPVVKIDGKYVPLA